MPAKNSDGNNIGGILLAAGESSRLGKPKQLLKYSGQTLLQHSLKAATTSVAGPVIVVLGAYGDNIKSDVESNSIYMVINTEWMEGVASSIRYGINTLLRIDPLAEGAVLLLCDQPYVTSDLLNNLIKTHQQTGKHIVACNYGNTFGPPVFFHRTIFPELLQLKGDIGAKGVIKQHSNDVELVLFPEGSIDIDTEEDFQKLSNDNRAS